MGQREESRMSKRGVQPSKAISRDRECSDETANRPGVVSHSPWETPGTWDTLWGACVSIYSLSPSFFWGMLV